VAVRLPDARRSSDRWWSVSRDIAVKPRVERHTLGGLDRLTNTSTPCLDGHRAAQAVGRNGTRGTWISKRSWGFSRNCDSRADCLRVGCRHSRSGRIRRIRVKLQDRTDRRVPRLSDVSKPSSSGSALRKCVDEHGFGRPAQFRVDPIRTRHKPRRPVPTLFGAADLLGGLYVNDFKPLRPTWRGVDAGRPNFAYGDESIFHVRGPTAP